MLNKATLDSIAKAIGVDVEVLTQGITSEEETAIEIKTPEHQFTSSELESLKDNLAKEGYDRGAKASREMTLKEMSKAAGFEESIKDADKFLSSYKNSILEQAQAEPNEQIKELQTSIERLQGVVQEKDRELTDITTQFQQKERVARVGSYIPSLNESLGLKKDEVVSLFMQHHEITDEGIKRDGKLIKDNVENPLGLENVVQSWISDRGWNNQPTGRGGGSGGGKGGAGLPTSMGEYKEYIAGKGWSEGSQEANGVLSAMIKENPDIGDE